MNVHRIGNALPFSAVLLLNGAPDPDLAGTTVQAALADPAGVMVPGSLITVTVDNVATGAVSGLFTPAMTVGLAAGIYAIVFKGAFAQGPIEYAPVPIRLLPAVIP